MNGREESSLSRFAEECFPATLCLRQGHVWTVWEFYTCLGGYCPEVIDPDGNGTILAVVEGGGQQYILGRLLPFVLSEERFRVGCGLNALWFLWFLVSATANDIGP